MSWTPALLRARLAECRLQAANYRLMRTDTRWTYRFLNAQFYRRYRSLLANFAAHREEGRDASPDCAMTAGKDPQQIARYWLAVFLVALLLLCCAVAYLCAAQDRSIASPDRLAIITATPVMDMSGTPVAFILRANFQSIESKPSGEITAIPAGSVEVDLLKSNGSVVVGGELTYDKEIADLLVAVAHREWAKANPAPLPVRRKALRQP